MRVSEIMSTEVKTIEKLEPVTKALSLMQREHVKELPVLASERFVGLITFHSIITNTKYDPKTKVSKLMIKPPTLSDRDNVSTAIQLMSDSGIDGLPVIKAAEVIGFISDYDILKARKDDFKNLTVNDFMKNTELLTEDDKIGKARKLMHYKSFKALPVINNKGQLVSVLYEEDLTDFYKPHESMGKGVEGAGDSSNLLDAPIKGIIRKQYYTVRVGEKINKVIDLMIKRHLSSIIVIDEGKPIGYFERFELLKYLNKSEDQGVYLEFKGLELDLPTNALLTKVVKDHLSRINYLAKNIAGIKVRIKPLHAGEGVRKFELNLKIQMTTGVKHRIEKVGYALRECLDEALTDAEKIMKKEYKKNNP